MAKSFYENLTMGQKFERAIEALFLFKGWFVDPLYDLPHEERKGPRLTMLGSEFISPDLLVDKDEEFLFVECKVKSYPSYYRKDKEWQLPLDNYLLKNYISLVKFLPIPFIIMFNILDGYDPKADKRGPSGVYYYPLSAFRPAGNHVYDDKTWINIKDMRPIGAEDKLALDIYDEMAKELL